MTHRRPESLDRSLIDHAFKSVRLRFTEEEWRRLTVREIVRMTEEEAQPLAWTAALSLYSGWLH